MQILLVHIIHFKNPIKFSSLLYWECYCGQKLFYKIMIYDGFHMDSSNHKAPLWFQYYSPRIHYNTLRPRQNVRHWCRRYFQVHFLEWKLLNFKYDLTEICFLLSNWHYGSIGSDNGLAPQWVKPKCLCEQQVLVRTNNFLHIFFTNQKFNFFKILIRTNNFFILGLNTEWEWCKSHRKIFVGPWKILFYELQMNMVNQ